MKENTHVGIYHCIQINMKGTEQIPERTFSKKAIKPTVGSCGIITENRKQAIVQEQDTDCAQPQQHQARWVIGPVQCIAHSLVLQGLGHPFTKLGYNLLKSCLVKAWL